MSLKNHIWIFIFISFITISVGLYFYNSLNKSVCSQEDLESAKQWNYSPQDAIEFGLLIQKKIREQDMQGIFNLVDGELKTGPRKNYALSKEFKDIFPKAWADDVLADVPKCAPLGWRGFNLGHGAIWYKKAESGWSVTAINGANVEEIKPVRVGWDVGGRIIHPNCFIKPWFSSDRFEEFDQFYQINDLNELLENPGRFLGTKVRNFESFEPSWCSGEKDCEKISIISPVVSCSPENYNFSTIEDFISIEEKDEYGSYEASYGVLKMISEEGCNSLAPSLKSKCRNSFLVQKGDYSGGSFGWDTAFGIYGEFDLPSVGLSIVPLKYFESINEALNYFD